MSFLRRHISAMLVSLLLVSNGYLFVPWTGLGILTGENPLAASQCCCAHPDSGMSCACCRPTGQKSPAGNNACSISSAPCSLPVVALSPNVLDPAVESRPLLDEYMDTAISKKFHLSKTNSLTGIRTFPFHPPQHSCSLS